eukprot:632181-Alexandrium_andersonii.AAC.1
MEQLAEAIERSLVLMGESAPRRVRGRRVLLCNCQALVAACFAILQAVGRTRSQHRQNALRSGIAELQRGGLVPQSAPFVIDDVSAFLRATGLDIADEQLASIDAKVAPRLPVAAAALVPSSALRRGPSSGSLVSAEAPGAAAATSSSSSGARSGPGEALVAVQQAVAPAAVPEPASSDMESVIVASTHGMQREELVSTIVDLTQRLVKAKHAAKSWQRKHKRVAASFAKCEQQLVVAKQSLTQHIY